MSQINVGIVGLGLYIPKERMSAKVISEASKGIWSEEAIINKLGIIEKSIPSEGDGTQEMGVLAALNALEDSNIDAKEIDVILCMGEEWKEYPLTTSALYIQGKIGAINAWGIDVQNRCCTTVSAMKMAKDMLVADDEINTIMVVGGYRNGDFVDYTDKNMSMMYNLSAGGGAIILKKNINKNLLLGSHIKADGSFARDAGVEIGGIANPFNQENIESGYKSLKLMNAKHMKDGLNSISMPNWYECIDKALEKSGYTRADIDYCAILHFKKSMHDAMLSELGLSEEESIYLSSYGHMGQVDQILSLKLAIEEKKVKKGSVILMVAAGIGYVWSANVIRWGEC
ncbi:3-oxoacyl-ACP synthase [uncultured Clostridium sp.]|uniref:3-oxoacyl-ACP synthase n=1 Tax=uncultured Clostridium sp. TaxID=59620 RepID=UPI0026380959|nr:3-oxoacyl-ACP synthase [uncultured Clostridium sp.]